MEDILKILELVGFSAEFADENVITKIRNLNDGQEVPIIFNEDTLVNGKSVPKITIGGVVATEEQLAAMSDAKIPQGYSYLGNNGKIITFNEYSNGCGLSRPCCERCDGITIGINESVKLVLSKREALQGVLDLTFFLNDGRRMLGSIRFVAKKERDLTKAGSFNVGLLIEDYDSMPGYGGAYYGGNRLSLTQDKESVQVREDYITEKRLCQNLSNFQVQIGCCDAKLYLDLIKATLNKNKKFYTSKNLRDAFELIEPLIISKSEEIICHAFGDSIKYHELRKSMLQSNYGAEIASLDAKINEANTLSVSSKAK